jgi:ribose transport system permease protein
VAASFADTFRRKPVVIGAYAALAVVFALVLARTIFGRYVRAIGDNERAARYTGLPIRRIKIWVYLLSGLLSGLAGVLYAAENHQGNPNAGVAYELDAIAAVVIGGTRLAGGKGSICGTIVGTLIIGVLTNMLRLNNVDSNVEMMVKAVIIVLAVAIQKQRKEE